MSPARRDGPATNRLLAALPRKDRQRLLPALEAVTLTLGDVLYDPGERLRHVYFPDDSVISLLSAVEDRELLEVGMVGREGMAGLSVFMGVKESRSRGLVQGTGGARRMTAAALRREVGAGGVLNKLLLRYTHSLLTQVSQSAACNRFHPVNARLARWLLMTHDRIVGDEFRLTQEFLSHMLGVRREGVTLAAGELQKRKLINYSRGRLRILDRAGLEAVSCKCYGTMKEEYDHFTG